MSCGICGGQICRFSPGISVSIEDAFHRLLHELLPRAGTVAQLVAVMPSFFFNPLLFASCTDTVKLLEA
jgi:hypothetical protein